MFPSHAESASMTRCRVLVSCAIQLTGQIRLHSSSAYLQGTCFPSSFYHRLLASVCRSCIDPRCTLGRGQGMDCIRRVAFHTGRPSTWLEKANAVMYASKNNANSKSSHVFTLNSAPDVSTDGISWSVNVTFIQAILTAPLYTKAHSCIGKPHKIAAFLVQ